MLKINSTHELSTFLKKGRGFATDIKIEFLDSEIDNEFYSKKINQYKNACGCNVGSVFTGLAILLCIGLKVSLSSYWGFSVVKQFLIACIFVVAFSLVGKVVGILAARYKLQKLIATLKKYSSENLETN